MKVVCISDTHCSHQDLKLPDGDILIHAGDFLNFTRNFKRSIEELKDFLEWFGNQPIPCKILVGGNHDLILDQRAAPEYADTISNLMVHNGIIYLNNESTIVDNNEEKIKIHGSPHTSLTGMAFGRTEEELSWVWKKIPTDTDILVTHSPPLNILDEVRGKHIGCPSLLTRIREIMPKYHIFGHIHEGYGFKSGTRNGKKTYFINASIESGNLPVIFTYKR